MTGPEVTASNPSARFVGLVRDGDTVGARIEYSRPEGGSSAIVFFDTESLNSHIVMLQQEWRDTSEEHAALSALITEASKKP